MKIKMQEYFQGTNQPSLEINKEYESADIGQALCDWLLEHGKAVDVTPPPPPKPKPKPKSPPKKPATRARRAKAREVKDDADS
jgi:hypothetical protein